MENTKEKLISDFKVLVGDAEELLRATANQAGERVASARKRIEQSVEDGKKTLADAENILFDKTKEAAEVREKITKLVQGSVVGIAAGVGLILGLLIRRD